MGIETKQERDKQVVGVPKGFERLLTNAIVGSCVHEKHAEQHEMAGDAAGLCVMDLQGGDGADLSLLNVVEAASMLDDSWAMPAKAEMGVASYLT